MKSLIIEDEATGRLLLKAMLSPYGECQVACDGKAGLESFRAALDAGQPYDLVCLDVLMPEMDGPAVLKEIRRMETSGDVRAKVIMITGVTDMKTVFESFKEVCNAYLVKPVDREKLLAHLRSFGLVSGPPGPASGIRDP